MKDLKELRAELKVIKDRLEEIRKTGICHDCLNLGWCENCLLSVLATDYLSLPKSKGENLK